MNYDFSTLDPLDFEDMSRDLIFKRDGIRLEAFSPGPDGGFDGRAAKTKNGKAMLQAKRYVASTWASFKRAIKNETKNIKREKPDRYYLTTAQRLTKKRKDALAEIIGPALKDTTDILGPADLNDLLREFPEVEQKHFKLWLASSAVLERFINAAASMFSDLSYEDIQRKVRLFATNESFPAARAILEKRHVLIISGPPGVGKTTLAEILGFTYVHEKWDFVGVRNIDDAFAALARPGPKVILFDDFLGSIRLDTQKLSASESKLKKFIRRARKLDDVRFIMTSRGYILEDARDQSDVLKDKRVDVSKYVLDVGVYTRSIKARILYNHLQVTDLPKAYIEALIDLETLTQIIDHKNYIPRIIEWMTDLDHLEDVLAEDYPAFFIETLNNPEDIWDNAYRKHIGNAERHLLITLHFMSSYGVKLEKLRAAFDVVHPALCQLYDLPSSPDDFEQAMRILEGSFIEIGGFFGVDVVNPSVMDYLAANIKHGPLLDCLAKMPFEPNWHDNLWAHITKLNKTKKFQQNRAQAFTTVGQLCVETPFGHLVKSKNSPYGSWQSHSLSMSGRLYLLLRLRQCCGDDRYHDHILKLTEIKNTEMALNNDGASLPEIIQDLRDVNLSDLENASLYADRIEQQLVFCITNHTYWPDEISAMLSSFETHGDDLNDTAGNELHNIISHMFDYFADYIGDMDQEGDLEDFKTVIEGYGAYIHRDTAHEKEAIDDRISELNEAYVPPSSSSSSSYKYKSPKRSKSFDDEDIESMFNSLKASN